MLSEPVGQVLVGCRVLIVEDRYLVADDLARVCRRLGAEVAGLAANVDQARAMAADARLDLAILDVDLRGQEAFEVAAILDERDVPFIFVTGYRRAQLPAAWRDRPTVLKPFAERQLVAALRKVLRPPGGAGRATS